MTDYLMHYGIKGMKWGNRKNRQVERMKSADNRTAQEIKDYYSKHYVDLGNNTVDGYDVYKILKKHPYMRKQMRSVRKKEREISRNYKKQSNASRLYWNYGIKNDKHMDKIDARGKKLRKEQNEMYSDLDKYARGHLVGNYGKNAVSDKDHYVNRLTYNNAVDSIGYREYLERKHPRRYHNRVKKWKG